MGQVISELVEKDPDAQIVAGVDIADRVNTSYPVYTELSACQEEIDVVIDFSSAKAVDALLDYCAERKDVYKRQEKCKNIRYWLRSSF